jgi:hypothetical protein
VHLPLVAQVPGIPRLTARPARTVARGPAAALVGDQAVDGWEEVGAGSASEGGISDNAAQSSDPAIAIAPDGTPYVAWQDSSSEQGEVYIRRWNGSTWAEVGPGSASGGGISHSKEWAGHPSIAITPEGTPYVTWTASENIETRYWDGEDWQWLDAIDASGMGLEPVLAVAWDGRLYVAWEDNASGDAEIYIRQWSDAGWQEVGSGSASDGGISENAGASLTPSIALAPDGTAYVAWQDGMSENQEIHVRRRAACAAFLPLVDK